MKGLKQSIKSALDSIPLIARPAFRLSLLDLVWRTARLRRPESAFNLYTDWREEQYRRYGFDFYPAEGLFQDTCRYYYGKVDRVALVLQYLEQTLSRQIAGEVAEFGVFWGFTAYAVNRLLEQRKSDKPLYLFDSFRGLPPITHKSDREWKEGMFATSEAKIRQLFEGSGRVRIIPGFFSATLPRSENLRFAFCHVDCDLYTSVLECLDYLYPRMNPGGVIVFDDYGFRSCEGAKKAITEFLSSRGEPFVTLPTGQAVFIARETESKKCPT